MPYAAGFLSRHHSGHWYPSLNAKCYDPAGFLSRYHPGHRYPSLNAKALPRITEEPELKGTHKEQSPTPGPAQDILRAITAFKMH